MKVLLLAGGRGKRLDELSLDRNKCMVEVRGRPVIDYNLDCAVSIDIDEIVVIVGYRAEDVMNHVGGRYRGVPVSYVMQKDQKGLVHAMECARGAVGENDFMLMLADEIMVNPRHRAMMDAYRRSGAFIMCGILSVEDRALIRKNYSVIQDAGGKISRLVEKPADPVNELMGTGDCIFNREIFDYVRDTPVNRQRGEKELPDLIQHAIDSGREVRSFNICDRYVNINTMEDIRIAEELLP